MSIYDITYDEAERVAKLLGYLGGSLAWDDDLIDQFITTGICPGRSPYEVYILELKGKVEESHGAIELDADEITTIESAFVRDGERDVLVEGFVNRLYGEE